MAWIDVVDEPGAQGDLAGLYRIMVDPEFNQVDNIMKIHSLHPSGLRAHYDLYRAVMKSTPGLPKVVAEEAAP